MGQIYYRINKHLFSLLMGFLNQTGLPEAPRLLVIKGPWALAP